jgi:hypothetical protein
MSKVENKAFKESVIRKVSPVEDSLGLNEAQLLSELASQVSEGYIAEVGSYRGRSTVALTLGSQHSSTVPVYAIEPHEAFTSVVGGNFGPRDSLHPGRNRRVPARRVAGPISRKTLTSTPGRYR